MPESRFVSSERLMPLLGYVAVAFVVVLVLGALVPPGPTRRTLVVAWIIGFPIGAWLVYRRA